MSNQFTALPMPDRFWARVDWSGGFDACWPWLGSRQRIGYGVFRNTVAHRAAYVLSTGPIPLGLELDHLCANRGCVNPGHLEPVSRRENVMRSSSFAATNARKTHCPKGHPYAGSNLHVAPNGDRRCLTCKTAANAARYARLSTTCR